MSDEIPAIVLVDAYAQIYRSFYAIRSLTNKRGEPTNALYGIARLLLQLDRSLASSHGAILFDKGKSERRVAICPEYKAQRPPMPDDLRSQIAPIRDWMSAFGWPLLEQEGIEADDLIAAITARREQLPVKILTFDKDIAQLTADPEVVLLSSGAKDEWTAMGQAEVTAKYGVGPEQLGDFLALVGDASDNIRGVEGVGPKTAAKFLQESGGLDAFFADPITVSNERLREKVLEARELLKRNRELVRLDATLPENWRGLDTVRRNPPDWARLLSLAEEQGFASLIKVIQPKVAGQGGPQQLTLF
ncbi:MAG: hypothetical protein GX574_10980 [Lentisphaerae bacterium]|nr:hypothetical protein [Lentisphaerota bacterium]